MAISKRLALVVSGAAFAGAAALTMGATPAGAATTRAPATAHHASIVSLFGCGWGGCGCDDDCDWDCWDWC
jgi:hypothetical protein